jgi:hypothetical protein
MVMSKHHELVDDVSLTADVRELSVGELDEVSGGLNPQPLPPRYFFNVDYFTAYRPVYRF